VSERYRYGGALAEAMPAAGSKGVILLSFDGRPVFRVYDDAGRLTDFDLRHEEPSVTIALDDLASFYKIGNDHMLVFYRRRLRCHLLIDLNARRPHRFGRPQVARSFTPSAQIAC
jgi:hypothetical protein